MPAPWYNQGFGRQVVSAFGKVTPEKMRFMQAWAEAEGTKAQYNPLATTRTGYAGSTDFNSVGVKNFRDMRTGVRATIDTLKLDYYTELTSLMRRDDVSATDLAKAVAASPWGTGTGVLRVLGVTSADSYEVQKSKAKFGANKLKVETQFVTRTLDQFRPSEAWVQMAGQINPALGRAAASFQPFTITRKEQVASPQAEAQANQFGGTTVRPTEDSGFVPQSDNDTVNRILSIAHQQVGKPYIFGHAGPDSFDCSGLIEYAFEQAGVKTPGRLWTGSMIKLGSQVSFNNLQPGDWLVRHAGGKGHTVLYVGNGKVIAAPRSGETVQYQDASQFMGEGWQARRFPIGSTKPKPKPRLKPRRGGKGPKK